MPDVPRATAMASKDSGITVGVDGVHIAVVRFDRCARPVFLLLASVGGSCRARRR